MQFPTDELALRLKLFSLIKERSIRRGKFTLVSGRESNYYLDLKPTMLDPEGATLLPELILRRLAAEDLIPDAVTFYFGNNDATFNSLEDRVRFERRHSNRSREFAIYFHWRPTSHRVARWSN